MGRTQKPSRWRTDRTGPERARPRGGGRRLRSHRQRLPADQRVTHLRSGRRRSRYKFTHAADAFARIVIQNALFFGRKRASAPTIPWCTYTDPEVAQVGLYPKDAEAQGVALDTYMIEAKSDRALLDGETEGFLKIHARKGTDTILGATLVARHAGEMISEIALAMKAGAGLGPLAATIHPYPTQAEIFKKAGDAYNRTRLTPRVKGLFETLLRWRR